MIAIIAISNYTVTRLSVLRGMSMRWVAAHDWSGAGRPVSGGLCMTLYSRLLRPLVFQLDPELAHRLAIGAAGRVRWALPAVRALCASADPRLEIEIAGLRFANPIGLAAGFDKSGTAIEGLAALGFGSVEIGSISIDPSQGNPRPRLFRLPQDRAIVVHYGLPNDGARRHRRAPRRDDAALSARHQYRQDQSRSVLHPGDQGRRHRRIRRGGARPRALRKLPDVQSELSQHRGRARLLCRPRQSRCLPGRTRRDRLHRPGLSQGLAASAALPRSSAYWPPPIRIRSSPASCSTCRPASRTI